MKPKGLDELLDLSCSNFCNYGQKLLLGFCLVFKKRWWFKKIQSNWRRRMLEAEEENKDW